MITLLAIAAMAVAQSPVPDSVTNAAVELAKQGGFATAFVIACVVIVGLVAAVVYLWRALRSSEADSRKYERETNAKTFEVTGGLGQALKDSAQATRETAAALSAQNARLAAIEAKVGG